MIDLFGLPLSSILLFLLAGVLIGHLLWYQDRSVQREKLDGLESRYFKARGTARQRKSRYLQLYRLSKAQRSDLEQMRSAHEELLATHADTENDLSESRRELTKLRVEKRQSDDALADETRRSENVVKQLREVLEIKNTLEQRDERQASDITELKRQIASLQTQAERSQAEHDVQVEVVREQQETIQRLKNEAAAATDHLRTQWQLELDEKSDALARTQQDLVARCSDLDQTRSERDELQQQLEQARQQSRYFESELGRIDEISRQRDEMAADLQSAADSLGQQRELIEAREVDLTLLNEELAHLRTELKTATELLDQNAETQRNLLATVDQRDAKIEELDEQVEQLISTREEIKTLSHAIAERDQTIESRDQTIQSQQAELETHLATIQSQQAELETHLATIQSLEVVTDELNLAKEESTQLRSTIDALQTETYEMRLQLQTMWELEQAHASVTNQFEALSTQNEELQRELSDKSQLIDRQNSDLRKLAEEVETLEPLQEKLAEALSSIDDYQTQSAELESQCTEQQERIARLEDEALQVPELNESLRQTVTKLELSREETAGALSRVAELNQDVMRLQAEFAQLQETESTLHSELDLTRQQLTDSQGERDDLISQNQQLQDRVENLQGSVAEQSNEMQQQQRSFHAEIDRYRHEVESLQSRITEQAQAIDELHRQLSERCGMHETAAREANELQQRVREEQERQQQLDHQNIELEQRVKDLTGHLKRVREELDRQQLLGQQQNKELERRVMDLTGHLRRVRDELEDSLEANAEAHDQIRKLRRERGSIPDLDDDRRAA